MNIDIKRKEDNNEYRSFYTDNIGTNIISTEKIDAKYRGKNIIDTLNNIANQTIAPDAAYWQYISPFEYHNVIGEILPICCNNFVAFVALVRTGGDVVREYNVIFYNTNAGRGRSNSWYHCDLHYECSSLVSPTHVACRATYLGYDIIANGGYNNLYTSAKSDLARVILPYYDNYSFYAKAKGMLYPMGATKSVKNVQSLPHGFLIICHNASSNGYTCDITTSLYTRQQLNLDDEPSWDNINVINEVRLRSDVSGTYIKDAVYDETLRKLIYRNIRGKLTAITLYNKPSSDAINIDLSGKALSTKTTALHRVFCLYNNYIYYFDYVDDHYHQCCVVQISLPDFNLDATWKYIFGNDYRLYLVSEEGDIAYLRDVHDDWHIANQSINNYDEYFSLKSIVSNSTESNKITQFRAATDKENTYIVAVINNETVIRTDVNNLG